MMTKAAASQTVQRDKKLLGRVLSIQSHVVRGYVGNKAAVFPLQLLGHRVDYINSVQFTSSYIHEGERVEGAPIKRILETLPLAQRVPSAGDHPGPLTDESLIDPTLPVDHQYLLTGYVGSATVIHEIVNFVKNQKKSRRERLHPESPFVDQPFLWLCDPVMGDNGMPYVPRDVIQAYKDDVVPLADILTPNQFELEWLCDRQVKTIEDAVQCCKDLHMRGPKIVVVTSIEFSVGTRKTCNDINNHSEELTLLASEKLASGKDRQFVIKFPRLNVYLCGTGDLMAAMLLDGIDRYDGQLDCACERALSILQDVIRKTMSYETKWHDIDVVGTASEILDPTMKFNCVQL